MSSQQIARPRMLLGIGPATRSYLARRFAAIYPQFFATTVGVGSFAAVGIARFDGIRGLASANTVGVKGEIVRNSVADTSSARGHD